jgi:rhodanese-related sulfurtransferase
MKIHRLLLVLLLVLGLALVACGGSTAEPAVQEEAAPVVEEPVAEEAAPVEEAAPTEETAVEEAAVEEPVAEVAEADLDGAFQVFLDDMEGYNALTIDALNEMLAEGDVFLLDVREASELEEKGWIEGAVHIPLREVADNVAYLPSEDTTIVSYCGSGWRCTIALVALEAMGWDNVVGLKGGSFGGWLEAGNPIVEGEELPAPVELNAFEPDTAVVAEMQAMLHAVPEGYGGIAPADLATELVENPDLILIDVRTAAEVAEKGYIDAPNVVFVPLEEFIAMKDQWPADLDAPIVTYCGSGHRSTLAMTMLWSYGYTDVRSMKEGYAAWLEGGFPTIGAPEPEATLDLDGAFQAFLDGMESYDTLGLDALNTMIVEGEEVFLLDVREVAELEEKGWIENAVNIPLREVADSVAYLPSFETPIVSYCGSGWRCTIALVALEAMGWQDVKALKEDSFGGWVEAGYPIVEGELPELMALNAAEPDPAMVAAMSAMLQAVPEGYGGISADDLFLAQGENPEMILMDVRKVTELEENGIIEHDPELWLNVPLESFVASQAMWPEDLDAPIVVYCGSGHRSTIAMTMLWSYGYTNVLSLKGGFGAWTEAEYPVVEYVP